MREREGGNREMGIGIQTDRQRQRVGEREESERGGEGRGLELIGKLTIAHQLFVGCG